MKTYYLVRPGRHGADLYEIPANPSAPERLLVTDLEPGEARRLVAHLNRERS